MSHTASVTGQLEVPVLGNELVVISGRRRGHRIPLGQQVLRIGRDRECELALDDEAASRVHSEIVKQGEQFVLRDLESTNGTFLNDARIKESALQNGDRIGVGDTILLLQLDPKRDHTTRIVFSKEHVGSGQHISISLNDTRFLEIKEGTAIPDAQRQFTRLYEFMVDIAGILHPPALLDRALEHFFQAFKVDRGLILLLTADGEPGIKATRLREGVGGDADFTISRTMAQQLLQKKESFLSVDAASDERLAASKSLQNMRVYSLMGAPLKLKDKALGMIYLDTLNSGAQFSEEDLKLCTAMALQLAVCLENARLYTELLDAAEFNHAVLHCMASAMIVVDTEGYVLRTNRATQEILGIEESNLLGHSLKEFPELAELYKVVQHALATGRSEDRGEVLVRSAKEVVPIGISASVLSDHTGKMIGAVANFRNLAQIRKLEEQVRRSEHLASLGQMAASVAHEIRTPLNSIRGFAQLLQEQKDMPAETRTEFTQTIRQEVDRVNRLVQDLLDFSRQRPLTLIPMQIQILMTTLVSELKREVADRKVSLDFIDPGQPLPNILGHSEKLRQLFRNLIVNALQACSAGGRVTVGLKLSPSSVDPSKHELAVVVKDNGCGMAADVLPRIFDPFFTKKDSGTGLGLSIAHKIADQHDARIDVESEIGNGSTFSVVFKAV